MRPLSLGMIIAEQETGNQVRACLQSLPAVRVVLEELKVVDSMALLEKLDRARPDVVLLELTSIREPIEGLIGKIKRLDGSPVVIAVHTATDPETILSAIRAGASEYLYPPLCAHLETALKRISSERAEESNGKRAGAAAFFSAKGGCGATTIACHVAVEVQRQSGGHVLLADFDLDSGIVGFIMKSRSSYNLVDALSNINRLDASYWKALISNGRPGMEILSAPLALTVRQPADIENLQFVLHFARTQYDWVIVDLGRGITPAALSALQEVDQCFLVSSVDVPALYKCKHVVRSLLDAGYSRERLRLIMNRIPRSTEITKQEIEQMLGVPVNFELPEEPAALSEAYTAGGLLAPGHSLTRRMSDIARDITQIPEEKPAKRRLAFFG